MNNPWGVFPTPLFDMIISSLELYDNLRYTEGSMVKPPIGDDLSGVPVTAGFFNLVVKRDTMFSEVNLPCDFYPIRNVSYLAVKFEDNNEEEMTYYGWVDDIQPVSDSDTPVTRILWHIDPWRTFAHKAVYASGIVTRSLKPNRTMPQPYQPDYWVSSSAIPLIIGFYDYDDFAWVHLAYVEDQSNITSIETISFPVSKKGDAYIKTAIGTIVKTPTTYSVMTGRIEEVLGIAPSSIVSAFVSLIPPITYTGSGTQSDPFVSTSDGVVGTSKLEFGYFSSISGTWPWCNSGYHYKLKATDTERLVVTGYYGEQLFEFPWGLEMDTVHVRTVIGGPNGYVQVSLGEPTEKFAEGMTFQIPLVPLNITSNSWSEYVYSGQRDADSANRRVQAELSRHQSNLSATTNAVNSLIGGAVGGAMAGGAVGAVGGAVLSGVTSYATSRYAAESTYQYMTGPYNDAMVNINDNLMSRQIDNVLLTGNGADTILHGEIPRINILHYNDSALETRENDIRLYGYHTKEPTSDCTHAVLSGEATRILNLDVSGEIPLYARNYIRNAYAQGVVQQ